MEVPLGDINDIHYLTVRAASLVELGKSEPLHSMPTVAGGFAVAAAAVCRPFLRVQADSYVIAGAMEDSCMSSVYL